MLEKERNFLFDPKREFISIGITEGGVSYSATQILWDSSSAMYNSRTPTVYIAPEDLSDSEIFNRICELTVQGLYIYTPLEDYSFIAGFTELWDLHIRCGENIKSLDFLSELNECFALFLQGVTVDDIDVIYRVQKADKGMSIPFSYLGIYDCNIGRTVSDIDHSCYFSELLVWSRQENLERDKALWSDMRADLIRFTNLSEC